MSPLATTRKAAAMLRTLRTLHRMPHSRRSSTAPYQINHSKSPTNTQIDVEKLLSKPTWSISSLLPAKDSTTQPSISSKQLHHLLRLSALPPPKDTAEEEKMLSTLSSQLHFVREIQSVDTAGVEPLRSLRDETKAGEAETEIGMEAMENALAMEEVRGRHHKRIKRVNGEREEKEAAWDVMGTAERRVGRYFVVEGGKDG